MCPFPWCSWRRLRPHNRKVIRYFLAAAFLGFHGSPRNHLFTTVATATAIITTTTDDALSETICGATVWANLYPDRGTRHRPTTLFAELPVRRDTGECRRARTVPGTSGKQFLTFLFRICFLEAVGLSGDQSPSMRGMRSTFSRVVEDHVQSL